TAWHFSSDGHGGTLLTDSLPGGSADLAQTVTAALTTQEGTADQFTFQSDGQSGTLVSAKTLTASSQSASATDTAMLDPSSSASSDHQSTAPTTTAADIGPASNVAATSQQPTGDTSNISTQAGATTQTAVAPAAIGPNGSDTFVFAANFGHETIANFHPDTDVIEIDHAVFADFQALLAATHDDGHGNAVIAANPTDSITIKNVTVAHLVQHQSDFPFRYQRPASCPPLLSLHAVACEVADDLCLDCLRCRDVRVATGYVALLELGKSASIERTRHLRVESQRRAIIIDGRVPLTHLEIGQPARVECGGDVRL